LDGRLAEDIPTFFPDACGDGHRGQEGFELVSEDRFEDFGEGSNWNEERLFSREPSVILRDASGWNKAVDVGMIIEGPGPGVKNTENAQ